MTGIAFGWIAPDDLVGFGREERKEVVRCLAFLDLPHRGPAGPDTGKAGERARFVECEPHRRPAAIRKLFVFAKASEGNDAAIFNTEPSSPVRRAEVSDIGDTGI